ncbi:MAG: 50S ribosomal protein L30 [Pseudobutyrivibrio sp.]|uniref:Large ribosomal subunit protein uL30 n=6 Tax=Pseudobutyrivibrio TaxID=46205 RepID=A0A2G3EA47_9FIRM|nr:50S ribosomal protein L30 [Pseudobutyrivibrio sp.]NEX01620.1 50S ribosomal protein L30 [Pseudobutyrivibrio xylanivorans]PHU33582.1 50S ribosomal protein L30 [Pseudobutyrivibrio ruminis]PHU40124.1 50S ribosomal protein L30 [Pseudobutyrivibrio ruminis]
MKTFLLKEESKMAEKKLRVTLVKSTIGAVPKNKKTVEALGLRKVNKTVELPDNDSVRGMLRMVNHLVKVEEI